MSLLNLKSISRVALVFSLFFSASFQAALAAPINAICVTEVGGTTTFLIETEGQNVNFQVINHNGGGYTPFWQSLVVPNDLAILEKKADIIKKIDKGFTATWKAEKCKWAGPNKFSCVGNDNKSDANGIEIKPWAIYSSVVNDSSFAGDYTYIDMTVSFEVGDEDLNITMRYQEHECILSKDKIKRESLALLKKQK